jgi:hypothetical protein
VIAWLWNLSWTTFPAFLSPTPEPSKEMQR